MTTHTASATHRLPFQLGEPRSFRGLAIFPLYPTEAPTAEYVGLDEAMARGLAIHEVDQAGNIQLLLLENRLAERVLLFPGEELVGAKQNRVVEHPILVEAGASVKVPVHCVERGRWAYRSRSFAPAPRAAYPALRKAQKLGQSAVWAEVGAKSARMDSSSPTDAAEQLYLDHRASLDEYLQALPRLDGQAGVLVGIAGRLVCVDYVSRPDVFAGLYLKLLRGYALEAIEMPVDRPLRKAAVGRFLGELELAQRTERVAVGLGQRGDLTEYAVGSELVVGGEVVAVTAFPAA
jgi:hypothetical protein